CQAILLAFGVGRICSSSSVRSARTMPIMFCEVVKFNLMASLAVIVHLLESRVTLRLRPVPLGRRAVHLSFPLRLIQVHELVAAEKDLGEAFPARHLVLTLHRLVVARRQEARRQLDFLSRRRSAIEQGE